MVVVLTTPRLSLRAMDRGDTDRLLGIFGDPEAMRYYPATKDRRATEEWIDWILRSYAEDGIGLWIVERREAGEFLGQCGLTMQEVEGQREPEIGYLFLRSAWGQGYATEAARACRDHAFGSLGYARLISLSTVANRPSQRVAERIGMTLEREIERRGKRTCVYAMDRPADTSPSAAPEREA